MSSPVAELEAGLQGMLSLKPPGVSGSRIQNLTTLCSNNVQSESVLVQKLYTHFMRAPASHKLGVLYVVDSVTRKWVEQAKLAGQTINLSAEDGTFAAGVNRVKELLPNLMNNIIPSSPDKDQKDKIRKLIDIWEKSQTFPISMLNDFKEKLNASMQCKKHSTLPGRSVFCFSSNALGCSLAESTTPPGSPPADLQRAFGAPAAPAAPAPPTATATTTATSAPSILEALANLARHNTSVPAPIPAPQAHAQAPSNPYNVSSGPYNAALQAPPFPTLPITPPVNVPATFASLPQAQGLSNGAQNFASNQTNPNPYAAVPSVMPGILDPAVQQQLLFVKALADQGLTQEQISGIIAHMGQGVPGIGAGGLPPPPPQFPVQQQNQNQNGWMPSNGAPRPDESRDHSSYHDREAVRSPPSRYRQRSRSRSPPRGWNAHDSPGPRRRDEPNNFDYSRNSPARNQERGRGGRGGRGSDYRQRSPPRRGRSPTPPRSRGGPGQKWIDHDPTLAKGNIKVLSRTLFVGGVTTSEQELRGVFENYGRVQTCIVNKEKRHAFVKMISRADAIRAKEAMEKNRTPDSQLRTRWGVGFGPRDCSDYQTGVSIIPISKLTDADRKWMLSAEYGGSGGTAIESGMVVEEPDIEIGQGVSSKAISRRMQTDKGGSNGPKSSRDREEEEGQRFGRRGGDRDHRRDDDRRGGDRRDRDQGINAPPSMPAVPPFGMGAFPYPFPTNANGLPIIPANFVFPGQTTQPPHPPAPGHRT
ncbi:Rpb7-binding protein seb1 [Lachnellula suecica]|uniref:Rpb7-binding protein seb1 n=1 Tax=Lachnellula suecica TaxID=602035 RepID=A0A8T9CFD9_9HELO|nr:Rpb7-binding protein seb1 [Lachnellula suecica]